jgi:archaetidylinositol phosphate synthase
MADKKAERIQTSILNGVERKALIWLAERQPRWVVSDTLTFVGSIGALLIGLGFALAGKNPAWLWLSFFGFIVNWYGDSLDGSVARVRKTSRPIYGYYIDHTVDCINEAMMFIGIGLSPYMHMTLALAIFVVYLCLTVNVSIDAHLKSEFKLTYAKLGPTEFRLIAMILIAIFYFVKPLQTFGCDLRLGGSVYRLGSLDIVGIVILVILVIIYLVTIIGDARSYAKIDPMPKREDEK